MANLAFLKDIGLEEFPFEKQSQTKFHYDGKNKIGWILMAGDPRPCFSFKLMEDIRKYIACVRLDMRNTGGEKYNYLVLGSDIKDVFSLGGDLDLFIQYIQDENGDGLLNYAMQCIDVVYLNASHCDLDLTTVSLVQGSAFGGGFEAALSSNLMVAERGVKMGFPEVLFNLFPGMGAYPLLFKKVGSAIAERIILSGDLYSAEQLYDMGVVDILAEKGEGELALYNYIKAASKAENSYRSMRKVKDICSPLNYEDLKRVATIWVDSALQLTPKNLCMMQRLVRRQNIKLDQYKESVGLKES